MLGQNARSDLVNLADQLEHGIIWKLAESKLTLAGVAWVGFAEDGVAVAWNNLPGVQGGPQITLNGLVAEIVADDFLHLHQPGQDFLVGSVGKISNQ